MINFKNRFPFPTGHPFCDDIEVCVIPPRVVAGIPPRKDWGRRLRMTWMKVINESILAETGIIVNMMACDDGLHGHDAPVGRTSLEPCDDSFRPSGFFICLMAFRSIW